MIGSRLPDPWAIILTGGDGTRLRPLTQRIAGDARPKQFCVLVEGETMLDRTRRRAGLLVRPDRHVVAVSAEHARFFGTLPTELAPGRLVVQPSNQGTLAAIIYALLTVEHLDGTVPVVLMPCDHDVEADRAFMDHVAEAVALVRALPDRLVLLGVEPEHPEPEYGWIEPSRVRLPVSNGRVFGVRRFWEKPSATLARLLHGRGCLWNSSVMVGWTRTLLDLVQTAAPEVLALFAPLAQAAGTPQEARVADAVYRRLSPLSFSERVLARVPERLLAIRVTDVGWTDWGQPSRVLQALQRAGRRPRGLEAGDLTSIA